MDNTKFHQVFSQSKRVIGDGSSEVIKNHADDPEWLADLKAYLDNAEKNGFSWSKEKIKIVLQILQTRSAETATNVLAYLKQTEYGWQGSSYILHNRCLRGGDRCRFEYRLSNVEAVKRSFDVIHYMFFREKYGGITAYLFGYCLAALFSSRLSHDNARMPYFLQIACERNSNTYKLIHEIVHICDVNAGMIEHCAVSAGAKYGCAYDHTTLFPTQSAGKTVDDLMFSRDVPVVIDGFENEVYYNTLLRETANIPGKIKNLDIKNRFNTLPIFICPSIKSQFRNILSLDLTHLEIDDRYLERIREYRQHLGAWALQLVKYAEEHTFCQLTFEEKRKYGSSGERQYFDNLNVHINQIRKDYRANKELSGTDITNIGLLSYFLQEYMGVIERSIIMNAEVAESFGEDTPRSLIETFIREIINSLVKIHSDYSPLTQATLTINTEETGAGEASRIRKKGEKFAKDIVAYYQSFGVAIKILPTVEYKNDRYIYSVKLVPGVEGKQLNRYADDVRRLIGVETFYIEKTSVSIKITVSEKALRENSLGKILASEEFINCKMDIPYAVGYDILGDMVIADISDFPHLLIGGTTGSGKSSALHSILTSIVVKQPPEKVKLMLIDFGSSRLKIFQNTPHMLAPVVRASEIEKGRQYVLWLQNLMKERLEKLDLLDERKHSEELVKWPSIICVIDEFPAFIRQLNEGRRNRDSHKIIEDLLERARKVKIHLILAAQDATKGNIAIKNTNLAAGIAFKCTNWSASKAIIDDTAATELSGKGAMYFKCDQHEGLKRMQGAFMRPEDIMDLLDKLDYNSIKADRKYDDVEFGESGKSEHTGDGAVLSITDPEDEFREFLLEIVKWIVDADKRKLSNKNLKDEFDMGYDRAKIFMDELEKLGIVTGQKAKLPRKVIPGMAQAFLREHGYPSDEGDSSERPDSVIETNQTEKLVAGIKEACRQSGSKSSQFKGMMTFKPVRKKAAEKKDQAVPVCTTIEVRHKKK